MIANRRRDTKPELAVRRALHARGLRYRVDYAPLGGRRKADIVFTRRKIAVFIDGCFWHGCPEHGSTPVANAAYWLEKLKSNSERDRETDEQLRDAGWVVLRYWEHDGPQSVVDRVSAAMDIDTSGGG